MLHNIYFTLWHKNINRYLHNSEKKCTFVPELCAQYALCVQNKKIIH